jgi:hypothetical protein
VALLDKRYQVFVSSTYEDLKQERQEVMQALLELDCIPAGMELFPAADADQWSLIKKVIDDSDYYILIMGGRYGSTTPEGISYTQKEYEYAASSGKPILGFVHKDLDGIVVGKSEKNEENRRKLEEFRTLVQQRVVKYWLTPTELGSVVSRSLIQLIKSKPSPGWVKADKVPDIDATNEILRLRRKIDELEVEVAAAKVEAPQGSEELAQGNDTLSISGEYQLVLFPQHPPEDTQRRIQMNKVSVRREFVKEMTWDAIFSSVAPKMLAPIHEDQMTQYIMRLLEFNIKAEEKSDPKFSHIHTLRMESSTFEVIKVQLRALGLITEEIVGEEIAWKLTQYGDYRMNQLLAVKARKT